MPGTLYIVSTPIGNFKDITLRALEVLQNVDAVICEEYRIGSTILKKLGIDQKDFLLLNEHNEREESQLIAQEILQGKTYALISDCGTPAFADPGTDLVSYCLEYDIPVIPVPGPSSLMAAISLSPLPMDEFYFIGFLPRKRDLRARKLNHLKKLKIPIILMDAPYRLVKLLTEIRDNFGKRRLVTLTYNLTLPGEKIIHGPINDVLHQMKDRKGEFILIVHK